MAVKQCCVKLSPNKKSIFGLRMSCQILYIALAAFLFTVASAADTDISCVNVKTVFEKKEMLSMVDIQAQPNSDADQLCLNQGCCGPNARSRLTQQARTQLESALRSELGKLAETLSNRAKKFDDFFKKLLKLSREEFHAMFQRTYGMIYEQHSYVFEQLFEEIERYYTQGDTNFDHMMDGFFGILYEKMFTVLNSQYNFDDKYLKCVNDHMRDIQPFEDVPTKLTVQLKRAVVATRTFHKALRAGADVIRNMMQVGVTSECVTSWARLRFCGTCGGLEPPPCTRYCHNVIRGCLPAHADLTDNWDAYVDAVDKVADRLLGPFNIAMVIEPIDIKVSEAIMTFQEHNQDISKKIFTGCGKPVLGGSGGAGPFFPPEKTKRSIRSIPDFDWNHKENEDDFEIDTPFETYLSNYGLLRMKTPDMRKDIEEMAEQSKSRERFLQYMKGEIPLEEYEEHERSKRDADPDPAAGNMDIDFKSYEFDGKKGPKRKKGTGAKSEETGSAEWGGPALEKLVRETRLRLRNSRQYWHHLPALLCTSTSITNVPCFNGTQVASYTLNAAGDGTAALASNPEVRGSVNPAAASTASAQSDKLRALTTRLKDAYNGIEVHWTNTDLDLEPEASNQGATETGDDVESGSGSGDYSLSGPPGDDEDGDYDTDGSGLGPPDEMPTEIVPSTELPVTETPFNPKIFIPDVVEPPNTNNVQNRGRVESDIPNINNPLDGESETPRSQDTPVKVQDSPVTDSAERPSLQKALFTYALPVVCAWFGTIVTDLF